MTQRAHKLLVLMLNLFVLPKPYKFRSIFRHFIYKFDGTYTAEHSFPQHN